MTTKKAVSHSHTTKSTSTTEAAPAAATPTAASTAAAPSTTTPVIFIKPPPSIPSVPDGNQNKNGRDYVADLPKKLEMAAMPDVIDELGRFTDYTAVFGKTAPPLEYVIQTATAAGEWTAMRLKTVLWDAYARSQEGAAWTDFRDIMDMLRPALALAVKSDATIARQFPAMVRLFGARSVIAQRGVTTRALNKAAKADGSPPVRGPVAKKLRRAKSAAATLAAAGHPVVLPAAPATPPVEAATGATSPPAAVASGAAAAPATGAAVANGGAH